ncbi:hypothetical protein ABKF45_001358 [Escherichia coli]|uniref:hypothetical protein n=1 Tax=Escherichia coli TaxID=562 RepID=UPI000D0A0155|nr:hypothetical protein [Escherichia coli]EFA4039304.1 hypothetical protein [Escherichia coli O120:H10]EFO2069532.1 hypothetical protein [Escherichia coli O8]EKK2473202.1 hypothetical protein [Escherichia coli O91]MBY7197175.1 DNA polymerase III subunit theta [Escherichia fergusonii]
MAAIGVAFKEWMNMSVIAEAVMREQTSLCPRHPPLDILSRKVKNDKCRRTAAVT